MKFSVRLKRTVKVGKGTGKNGKALTYLSSIIRDPFKKINPSLYMRKYGIVTGCQVKEFSLCIALYKTVHCLASLWKMTLPAAS